MLSRRLSSSTSSQTLVNTSTLLKRTAVALKFGQPAVGWALAQWRFQEAPIFLTIHKQQLFLFTFSTLF